VAPAISLTAAGIDFVLLDIEGTTTPIAFVHDVLFPYARARVRTYLEENAVSDAGVRHIVEDLRRELPASGFPLAADVLESPNENPRPATRDPRDADIVSYVYWLMDRDRKSGPLKALQGRIWEEGYVSAALKGEVYPDVRGAFVRWTESGRRIGIFSSGSVLAQQLLFGRSSAGDLSTFLSGHFDTAVGAKSEPESYRRIVAALSVHPARTLFVSDVVAELDAARAAGLRTLLCVRPPAPAPAASSHDAVLSFDAIEA
jgi:enolase-phosphatase E1